MSHDFRDRPAVPPLGSHVARRVRCVSTKLTEADYARCLQRAGSRSLGEWSREVLVEATMQRPIEELLLAEVLALRTIVINLQFAVATQGVPTPEQMQGLVERADRDKVQRAIDRLAAASRA